MEEIEKKEFELLKRENQLLKTIIDSIHEGVYATNEKGEIMLYNREVEKTEGMKREEVLGKNENDVYSGMPGARFQEIVTKKIIETKKPLVDQYINLFLPNGRKSDIVISAFPFFYENELAAVCTIGRDLNTIGEFIGKTLEIKKRLLYEENNELSQGGTRFHLDDIIGVSSKTREAVFFARKVARQDSPVLIVGETGTGKELFAQGIHNASVFSKGPFVPINCAAIPETLLESLLFGTVKGAFTGAVEAPGLFEQAEDGTIFLDEINSMPLWLQAKLLRVLQDKMIRRIGSKTLRPINCRIISATNIDPFAAIKDNKIRSDVFFRLSTFTLNVPPLRERKGDIPVLVKYFLKKYSTKYGLFVSNISLGLLELFEQYEWPGNIRELQNVLEGAMNFVETDTDSLHIHHLPAYFREILLKLKGSRIFETSYTGKLHDILTSVEKKVIEEALQKNKGNISKSATELGIFREALYYRIKKLGIKSKR
ncbi:MAG: sigma 54-interacting transcriptional regulator [Dehalobacterium sp.]